MNKELRWKLRFENFDKALTSLKEVVDEGISSNEIIIDATIQRFEVTFELAWKTIQDYIHEAGFAEIRGPKNLLLKAFNEKIVEDGQLWSNMLSDRNILSHEFVYNESRRIYQNVVSHYFEALSKLKEKLSGE